MELKNRLKQVFGYDSFREHQEEIMEASLVGKDVVAVLPTGGGKSLCYQLPALFRDGLTVVVSPLIALMKDQVDQLQAVGVGATYLNSSLDAVTSQSRLQGLERGDYKLLYLARISHGDLHKNGEIGGQSRMVRGANQNQPTISPCNRLLKANLNFKGIMAVV